jgi:hypothetical protein
MWGLTFKVTVDNAHSFFGDGKKLLRFIVELYYSLLACSRLHFVTCPVWVSSVKS